MAWCNIHGHDHVAEQFRRSLNAGRLASTFLFVGPSGVGKRLFAIRLAQALLCDTVPPTVFQPCLSCATCRQIDLGNHPDVDLVGKPANKSLIPLELFIGDRDHRGREGLCRRISLKPASGRHRIAIIDDADLLSPQSANCLLKTLEEPPPRSLLVLLGTSEQRQLPTVRSRCQTIRFRRLPDDFVRTQLLEMGLVQNEQQAAELAVLAEGSLDRARQFADEALAEFREAFWTRLGDGPGDSQDLAKWIGEFVEAAGREATLRRERLRYVIRLFVMLYRQLVLIQSGTTPTPLGRLSHLLGKLNAAGDVDVEFQSQRLDRCLEALQQVDANANLRTLIECWIDDLSGAFGLAVC